MSRPLRIGCGLNSVLHVACSNVIVNECSSAYLVRFEQRPACTHAALSLGSPANAATNMCI